MTGTCRATSWGAAQRKQNPQKQLGQQQLPQQQWVPPAAPTAPEAVQALAVLVPGMLAFTDMGYRIPFITTGIPPHAQFAFKNLNTWTMCSGSLAIMCSTSRVGTNTYHMATHDRGSAHAAGVPPM